MKKRLNLILNGKGGVGKSFFAVNFVQYLKDKRIPHIALDSDDTNSTLKRFHPEAQFFDVTEERELDSMIAALDAADLAVVDCRAASTDIFLDYFDRVAAFELLASLGADLTVLMPVTHEPDSVEQVRTVAERFNSHCKYVIIRNEVFSPTFEIFDQTKIRSRVLCELRGREISMTKLQDWLVLGLNQTRLTITQAKEHSHFSLLDRQRLIMWQRRLYEEIESVRDFVTPAASPVTSRHEADQLL